MQWYEHIFGIAALIFCMGIIPTVLVIVSTMLLGKSLETEQL